MDTYEGFKIDDLNKVFSAIQNPQDWKDEINGWCYGEEVSAINAAIKFYTATQPEFTMRTRPTGAIIYVYHSEGYRKGPADDH